MAKAAVVGAVALSIALAACGGGATGYEVVVGFNTSVQQDDLDEADALLRTYDEDLDFLIQESFPPVGRATLETDETDFCATIEPELEAKPYVDDVMCEER